MTNKKSQNQLAIIFYSSSGLAYCGALQFLFDDVGFFVSFFGYIMFMVFMGLGLFVFDKTGTLSVIEKKVPFIAHSVLTLLSTLIILVGLNAQAYKAPFFAEEIAALEQKQEYQTFEEIEDKDDIELEAKFQVMDKRQSMAALKVMAKNKQVPDLIDMEQIRVMPLSVIERFVKQQEKAGTNLVFTSIVRQIRHDIRI